MDNIEFYLLVYSSKSETFLIKLGEYFYTEDVKEIMKHRYFENAHCQTIFNLQYYIYTKTGKLASQNDMEFMVSRLFQSEEQKKEIFDIISDIYQFDGEINFELVEEEALKYIKDRKFAEALTLSQKDLEEKNYEAVIERLEKSTQITFDADYGVDIKKWDDVKDVLHEISDTSELMPTGYDLLDSERVLNGGLSRKTLTCIGANSGVGKTLFMNNLALNFALSGRKVIYISLETSTARLTSRIMANLMNTTTVDISYNINENDGEGIKKSWEEAISSIPGELRIKEFASGSMNCNQITAFLLDMKKNTGFEPDVIFIDYLSIMKPNDRKISKADLYAYDGAIAVELREMAYNFNVPVITGVQMNREGLKGEGGATRSVITTEYLANSLQVEMTADFILTLAKDAPHQKKNQLVCYVAKSRNSDKGQSMTLQLDSSCRLIEVKEQKN